LGALWIGKCEKIAQETQKKFETLQQQIKSLPALFQ